MLFNSRTNVVYLDSWNYSFANAREDDHLVEELGPFLVNIHIQGLDIQKDFVQKYREEKDRLAKESDLFKYIHAGLRSNLYNRHLLQG